MYVCNAFEFKNFGMGIYRNTTRCIETEFTHTSVVMGYGMTKNGEKYWEILNSYGKKWGFDGSIRLAKDTAWDEYGGQNGILTKPTYNVPLV